MEVIYTQEFIRQYKKLPKHIQVLAQKKEEIFIINPYSVQLRTHKLRGKLDGYLALSINLKYRVVFRFRDSHSVYFVAVGGHEVYK